MTKKTIIRCASLVLVVAAFTPAHAENWYGSLNAGAGDGSGDFELDTGYLVEGAVGYAFGSTRVEGELSYFKSDTDGFGVEGAEVESVTDLGDGDALIDAIDLGSLLDASTDISTLTGMFNIWYDFDTGSKFTPFIGGGIGVSEVSFDISDVADESDTVFAWQVGAGLNYQISDNTSISARYKYFATQEPDFADTTAKLESITLGILYQF